MDLSEDGDRKVRKSTIDRFAEKKKEEAELRARKRKGTLVETLGNREGGKVPQQPHQQPPGVPILKLGSCSLLDGEHRSLQSSRRTLMENTGRNFTYVPAAAGKNLFKQALVNGWSNKQHHVVLIYSSLVAWEPGIL